MESTEPAWQRIMTDVIQKNYPTITSLFEIGEVGWRKITSSDRAYVPAELAHFRPNGIPITSDVKDANCYLSRKALSRLGLSSQHIESYGMLLLANEPEDQIRLAIVDLPEVFSPDQLALGSVIGTNLKSAADLPLQVQKIVVEAVDASGSQISHTEMRVPSYRIPEVVEGIRKITRVTEEGRFMLTRFFSRGMSHESARQAIDFYRSCSQYALSPLPDWCPIMSVVQARGRLARKVRFYIGINDEIENWKYETVDLISRSTTTLRDPKGALVCVHTPKGAGKTSAIGSGRFRNWDQVYDSDFFYYFNVPTAEIPYHLKSREEIEEYFTSYANQFSSFASRVFTTMRCQLRLLFVHYRAELNVVPATKGMRLRLQPPVSPWTAMFYRLDLDFSETSKDDVPFGSRLIIEDWNELDKEDNICTATLEDLVVLGEVWKRAVEMSDL
jgi:putative component of membrane protein insertase Oxa1/YidC/SpoIIIJ protein YidD